MKQSGVASRTRCRRTPDGVLECAGKAGVSRTRQRSGPTRRLEQNRAASPRGLVAAAFQTAFWSAQARPASAGRASALDWPAGWIETERRRLADSLPPHSRRRSGVRGQGRRQPDATALWTDPPAGMKQSGVASRTRCRRIPDSVLECAGKGYVGSICESSRNSRFKFFSYPPRTTSSPTQPRTRSATRFKHSGAVRGVSRKAGSGRSGRGRKGWITYRRAPSINGRMA